MKIVKYAVIVVGIIMITMASTAIADQVRTVGGSGYGPYQTGQGGEFTLQVVSGLSGILNAGYVNGVTKNVGNTTSTFQTFCLEYNEYIYPNTTYNVGISNNAMNGGVGGAVNNKDPLSMGTAWLYSHFATGGLAAYGYKYNMGGTSAANLQNAIWMLENEIGYNASNPFINAMLTTTGWTKEFAFSNANGAYGVEVLNMSSLRGEFRQDQLVMTSVPEPSALLLLGIAMVGIAIWFRKMNSVEA